MKALIDDWIMSGTWRLAVWSLQWALVIAVPAVLFSVRPPRRGAVGMWVLQTAFVAGTLSPIAALITPKFWGPSHPVDAPARFISKANYSELAPIAVRSEKPQVRPEGSKPKTHVNPLPAPLTTEGGGTIEPARLFPVERSESDRASSPHWQRRLLWTMAFAWTIGFCIAIARWTVGRSFLRRLCHDAVALGERFQSELDDCKTRLGCDHDVRLAAHPAVNSPILVGVWRPSILVPLQWEALTASARTAVLLHELAHLQRKDHYWKLLEEAAKTCLFFHPLVRWLLSRIEAEREKLCDARAVQAGLSCRELASALIECCQKCGIGRPAVSVGMALPFWRRRNALDRIGALMEEEYVMPGWDASSPRLFAASLLIAACAVATTIGGFGLRAAELSAGKASRLSVDDASTPSVDDILSAYRENFARLQPLKVAYSVRNAVTDASIEADRQRLRNQELLLKVERADFITDADGEPISEEWFDWIRADAVQSIESLKLSLEPKTVEMRLAGWFVNRGYVWSDGKSFHGRWAYSAENKDVRLDAGPISPPENLQLHYGRSNPVMFASWSERNDPPLRCWFGNGGGRVAATLDDCTTVSLPPLGFVEEAWTQKSDWHAIDQFMAAPPEQFEIAGREQLDGVPTILVDSFAKLEHTADYRERVRAWIDPARGCLPLQLEWGYVDRDGKATDTLRRRLEVQEVRRVDGSYYPIRIKIDEYIPDPHGVRLQHEEIAAGKKREETTPISYVPGRSEIIEISDIAPAHPIEPETLALRFPDGATYINAVENKQYRQGDPQPLPPAPEAVAPGGNAPPLRIAQWLDEVPRNMEDFRGKSLVLVFPEKVESEDDNPFVKLLGDLVEKYADQDVIFIEIHRPGTDVEAIAKLQSSRRFSMLAAIDEGDLENPSHGLSAREYLGEFLEGVVVVGRTGKVTFNTHAVQEEEYFRNGFRAAEALSIPWPIDESAPEEQQMAHLLQIFSFWVGEGIDAALNDDQ